MKNCTFCGSQMTDTAQFCNVCGNQVPQAADMQQAPAQQIQQGYDQGAQQMQQPYAAQAPTGQMQGYNQGTQQMQQPYAAQMQGYDQSAAQMQQQGYDQNAQQQPYAAQTPGYNQGAQQMQQPYAAQAPAGQQARPRAPKKKKSPAVIILFIVLLILIFILSFLIGKVFLRKKASPYQKTAESFLKAYCAGDAEGAVSYCIEPSKKEVRSSVNALAAVCSFYGDNAKISYDIDKISTIDQEKITELQEELSWKYGYECTIAEAYLMTVTLKMSAGDKTETTEDYFITLKIGDNWYIWYGYGIS